MAWKPDSRQASPSCDWDWPGSRHWDLRRLGEPQILMIIRYRRDSICETRRDDIGARDSIACLSALSTDERHTHPRRRTPLQAPMSAAQTCPACPSPLFHPPEPCRREAAGAAASSVLVSSPGQCSQNTWVLFPRTFNKTNTRNKPKLLLNKSNSKDAGRVDGWAQAQAVTVEIVRWKGGQPSGSPSRSAFPLPWPTERRQRRCAR